MPPRKRITLVEDPPQEQEQESGGLAGWGAAGIRGLSGLVGAEGGPTGAGAAALGEILAQLTETAGGIGTDQSLAQRGARVATEAGLGAIPFGRIIKPGKAFGNFLRSGMHAGGGDVARQMAEQGTFDPREVNVPRAAIAGTIGGTVGAGAQRLLEKLFPDFAAQQAAEYAAKEAERAAQNPADIITGPSGRPIVRSIPRGPAPPPPPPPPGGGNPNRVRVGNLADDFERILAGEAGPAPILPDEPRVPYNIPAAPTKAAVKEASQVDKLSELFGKAMEKRNKSWDKEETKRLSDLFADASKARDTGIEAEAAAAKIAAAKAGAEPQPPTVTEVVTQKIPGGKESATTRWATPEAEDTVEGAIKKRGSISRGPAGIPAPEGVAFPGEPGFGAGKVAGAVAEEGDEVTLKRFLEKGFSEKAAKSLMARGKNPEDYRPISRPTPPPTPPVPPAPAGAAATVEKATPDPRSYLTFESPLEGADAWYKALKDEERAGRTFPKEFQKLIGRALGSARKVEGQSPRFGALKAAPEVSPDAVVENTARRVVGPSAPDPAAANTVGAIDLNNPAWVAEAEKAAAKAGRPMGAEADAATVRALEEDLPDFEALVKGYPPPTSAPTPTEVPPPPVSKGKKVKAPKAPKAAAPVEATPAETASPVEGLKGALNLSGTKSPKDVMNRVLDDLRQKAAMAPEEGSPGETIRLQVGPTTFDIPNTETALSGVAKRVKKAGSAPWQGLQEKLKNQKGAALTELPISLASALAGGLTGAAIGQSQGYNPILSGLAGAATGFALPHVSTRAIGALPDFSQVPQQIREAVGSPQDISDNLTKVIEKVPQIQRSNLLMSPTGLAANAYAGPYGSMVMAGLELALKGDPRGMEILKQANPIEFGRGMIRNRHEATKRVTQGELGRAEDLGTDLISNAFNVITASPAVAMTAGDITGQDIMQRSGLPEHLARQYALTSEPEWTHDVANLGRGPSDTNLQRVAKAGMNLMFPFKRTPLNIVERGVERIPGVGLATNLFRKPANFFDKSNLRNMAVEQGLGGLIGVGNYELAKNLDPDTARTVKRFSTNVAGAYSLPASLGFTFGQTQARNQHGGQVTKRIAEDFFPLPTTQPIEDLLNLGQGKIPRGAIPALFREPDIFGNDPIVSGPPAPPSQSVPDLPSIQGFRNRRRGGQ